MFFNGFLGLKSSQKTPSEDSNLRICLDVFFVSGLFMLNLFTRDLTHECGAKGIFEPHQLKKSINMKHG